MKKLVESCVVTERKTRKKREKQKVREPEVVIFVIIMASDFEAT